MTRHRGHTSLLRQIELGIVTSDAVGILHCLQSLQLAPRQSSPSVCIYSQACPLPASARCSSPSVASSQHAHSPPSSLHTYAAIDMYICFEELRGLFIGPPPALLTPCPTRPWYPGTPRLLDAAPRPPRRSAATSTLRWLGCRCTSGPGRTTGAYHGPSPPGGCREPPRRSLRGHACGRAGRGDVLVRMASPDARMNVWS